MIAAGVFDEPDDGDYDFIFSLERVLDGIETLIEKRRDRTWLMPRKWPGSGSSRPGDELVALSHRIHANPELGFEEEQACAWPCKLLDGGGLESSEVERPADTAFAAEAESRSRCTWSCAPSTTPCRPSGTPAATA